MRVPWTLTVARDGDADVEVRATIDGATTTTEALSRLVPAEATTYALPSATARTRPAPSTVATDGLVELQVTTESRGVPMPLYTMAASFSVALRGSVSARTLIATPAMAPGFRF